LIAISSEVDWSPIVVSKVKFPYLEKSKPFSSTMALYHARHNFYDQQRIASRLAGDVTDFHAANENGEYGVQAKLLDGRQKNDIKAAFDQLKLSHPTIWNVPGMVPPCNQGEEEDELCDCVFQHQCGTGPIYFFYSDHLGSSTFLSDGNGQPYQFFLNLPFGETMEEQFALSPNVWWKTPYLFNGKELDSRTSLYYYGARYYDPGLSVWLSVDPLAEKAPGWTPYRYAFNNPIRILDPDGQFETKFAARLYNAFHGFKGKVHYSESRGEYYVGRQINSSTEARYAIKWGPNTGKPVGGLINALDNTPQLAKTLMKHVANVLPSPTRIERSEDFGANRDEFNGGIQFSLPIGQGGGTGYSQNADVGPALDDLMSVAGVVKANGNTLKSNIDQRQFGADILQTTSSLLSAYDQVSGNQTAVDSICNGCGDIPHDNIPYSTYNKSGQVIESNKTLQKYE